MSEGCSICGAPLSGALVDDSSGVVHRACWLRRIRQGVGDLDIATDWEIQKRAPLLAVGFSYGCEPEKWQLQLIARVDFEAGRSDACALAAEQRSKLVAKLEEQIDILRRHMSRGQQQAADAAIARGESG